MEELIPLNYKQIYIDIITKKFPHKLKECKPLLDKKDFSALDVIQINQKIFGDRDHSVQIFNQKLRSYNKQAMIKILNYQKKHGLNNSQLAFHFKMSRNTIAKWKKQFYTNI
ncbi:helix-turn-helix domain-containing protein [Chryseobacterium sp. RP-3-3]|uniref:Helix-turn-helix domain-containing protein n=1 Tax=Chryseobacterium antibioticum TaxID=2728847 RepID=A0A7Y0AKJ9_9FLAO|nr:helix-turn-helix domain-containing protein [Chryseobacterium antibioticum]NML69048.1 helix-turn-helix domain-containing protein [Chryseobacterium antibioticum]